MILILAPVIVKYMKKIYLDKMKPHYSEHILSVPWPFVLLRFHCSLRPGMKKTVSVLFCFLGCSGIQVLQRLNQL